VFPSPLTIEGPFGRFADRLLQVELPDLGEARRDEVVAFVCRRATEVPAPLRVGLSLLASGVGAAARLAGIDRVTSAIGDTALPLVGELARMVRSLGFACVWETWPDTSPSGAAGEAAA
jgi:hypothetical protein